MMSPDGGGAEHTLHFATMKHDECGPCGVTVDVDKPYTKDVCKNSYPGQTEEWYDEMFEKIKDAHYSLKELFRVPTEHNKELEWKWYYHQSTGVFSDSELMEQFDKMITTIPSKERHEGFTLQVLGRLPATYAEVYKTLLRVSLATRLYAKDTKRTTRIPIPKPNKPQESRPISICQDLFCFTASII